MKIDCIIGIDPGAGGGIAVKKNDDPVKVYKMPKDLRDLTTLFQHYKEISEHPIVFIEKVQLRPDDVNSADAGANFGKAIRIQQMMQNFQKLKDLVEFADIPYVQVHPMSWQSFLKLRKKGEERQDRKNRYKRFAQDIFPEVRSTLWNADALLLVQFGRKKKAIDQNWILQNLPKRSHSLFS